MHIRQVKWYILNHDIKYLQELLWSELTYLFTYSFLRLLYVKFDENLLATFIVIGLVTACFEINFSGRQRGFDGVLYNL